MRKKNVTVPDGDTYVIGALNMDQVESIIAPADQLESKSGITRVHEIICMGLNNPIIADAEKRGETIAPGDERLWTSAKLSKEFDLISLPYIKDQILEFSNLKVVDKESEGEAKAAE